MTVQKNLKQTFYWILTALISLFVIEASLRLYFFQISSEHPFAMVRAFYEAKKLIYKIMPPKPVGIWARDARFGYSHIENAVGTHETADFDATYTIGGSKERYIPIPENPVGRILVLGGSFAFGHGVDDDENYPYILSTYWPRWQVVNKSVMGWGTSHAYLTLWQELEGDEPPDMVIYNMIPHHVTRNYIRRSWVKTLAKYDRGHPHFELINGNLAFQGVISTDNSLEDSKEIRTREIALSRAFLAEMQRICNKKQIPFIVILLGDNFPYVIGRTLAENGSLVLDLADIKIEGFEGDRHPNRADHKRIAEAVLGSFVPEILRCSEARHGGESGAEDCKVPHGRRN